MDRIHLFGTCLLASTALPVDDHLSMGQK